MRAALFSTARKMGLLKLISGYGSNDCVVLNLHRISDEKNNFFAPMSLSLFDGLLGKLAKDFEIITFADVDRKTKKPKMILSFDDGYKDFIDNAIPFLEKYSVPANMNLINESLNGKFTFWTERLNWIFETVSQDIKAYRKLAGELNVPCVAPDAKKLYLLAFQYLLNLQTTERDNIINRLEQKFPIMHQLPQMMNWDDAAYCIRKGIEIGSHSYSHISLVNETDEETLKHEITDSIQELRERLNLPIYIFSYPNSSIGQKSGEVVEREGIKFGLLVSDTRNKDISKHPFNLVNRVYMMNESLDEALFRINRFHHKLRKLF